MEKALSHGLEYADVRQNHNSLACFVIRAVWLSQNRALFQGAVTNPLHTYYKIKEAYENFEKTKKEAEKRTVGNTPNNPRVARNFFDGTSNRDPNM